MQNSDYWKRRFEQLEQTTNDMSREYCQEVDKSFRRAISTVESDIEKWYNRLAVNNEVSLLRAKQMLSNKELQEFKWTVEEYIKYGEKNSITQEWLKELENASAKAHIERLEAIKIQLQNQVEVAYGNLEDGLSTTLGKIYENTYYHTGYEIQKGLNVGSSMAAIDNDKIGKAIKRPWATDNSNFSSRIWKNKQQLINNLNTNLTQSIIRGEDPQRAINHISKLMNTSKTNVGRLVMTESAFISSSAQKDCFNELDVEQYEIVSTLDTKTSEICRELDGEVFDMKDYQPGVTAPPFHCWCRTTTCPYFDDEFTQGEERAYRDADGKTQYVKDMKYNEWYKKYVDKPVKSDIIESIVDDPMKFSQYTPKDLKEKLEEAGFDVKPLNRGSLKGMKFEEGGGYKVNFGMDGILQYHPKGRHHDKMEYYKISTGKTGTNRYNMKGETI
ncbi:minor capsid protein [Anaerosporobacter sp.]